MPKGNIWGICGFVDVGKVLYVVSVYSTLYSSQFMLSMLV